MSSTSRRRRLLPVTLLAASLTLAVGCDSKDESSNPVGGGSDVSSEDVALSAVDTMTFANDLLSQVQALAQADFSSVTLSFGDAYELPFANELVPDGVDVGRAGEEIAYDELEGAWILQYTESETTEEGTASATIYFYVQYLDGFGTPQVEPTEATNTMNVEMLMTLDASGESAAEAFDMNLDYGLEFAVSGLQTSTYSVVGAGDAAMDFYFRDEAGTIAFDLAMGWLMDVDLPVTEGACPSGDLSISFDSSDTAAYTFSATYPGSPSVSWTLYEGGAVVDSGSEVLDCGTPAL